MRRAFLIFLLSLFSIVLHAQQRTITFEVMDRNLSDVFKELEKDYGLHFAFAVEDIKGKRVTVQAENQNISQFLTSLLAQHQLTYSIVEEDFIAITKASHVLFLVSVHDAGSYEALPFATARILGTDKGYISNEEGEIEVVVADPSATSLEVSFLGYEKKTIEMGTLDPTKKIEVTLEYSAHELEEVIVKEYLNKGITIDDQASRISIDVQDMEVLPGLSERDILLSAQILAGIGSSDESAGGLNVRGSSRDNTFIYWNKIPIYQSAHYFGNISAFIPSSIGKVDIYKNYIPVAYGGSSSGLLLINSRIPSSEKIVAESSLNMTHGDLYSSLPLANQAGRLSIAARRSFNDVIATPTFNAISDKLFAGSLTEDQQGISDQFEYNSQLIFSDINAVIEFNNLGENAFSLNLLNSKSKLDYDSKDEENTAQALQQHEVETSGVNLTWTRRWVDRLSTEWSTSYADYHMDYALINIRNEDDETADDSQRRMNNLDNLESRFQLNFRPAQNHVFDFGYQFNRVKADLVISEDFFYEEDFSESIESKGNTHGVFTNYFGKFRSGIQLGVGIRHNYYEALKESLLDRQLRLNYELFPGLLLKSTIGVYHQYISSLKELDFVFSNTIEQNWITANKEEEVPVIKNEQVVFGALLTKAGWVIDVDGYIKQVSAPVAWNFGFRLEDEEVLVSGTETITGLDITLKKRWRYYRAWLSYSFQDSKVRALEERFISGLNIRHQLQLSQTLNYRQFEFALGYTLKSGLPYTQASGFERIVPEDDEEEPFFEINYEPLNSSKLPTYHRVDVSAWYKFKNKKTSSFTGEVGISILNLFDSQNLYSRSFSIEDDEEDVIFIQRSDRKLIGITPNLSLRLQF